MIGFFGAAEAAMSQAAEPGILAHPFKLESIHHGVIDLAELKGSPVLLSFISTGPEASLSRSQIVFLKSIHTQFGSLGVRLLLIDASRGAATLDDLVNFTYDWELGNIPLLSDSDGDIVANLYAVRKLPTTLLVSADGFVVDRWDGLANAAQLAMAVHRCLRPQKLVSDGCSGVVLRRALFPGLPPVRSLSEHIWVVEDEEPWEKSQTKTLRWVVLRPGSDEPTKIRILVTSNMQGETRSLLDKEIDPLSKQEAQRMIESTAQSFAAVYLITASVNLQEEGCHELKAKVFESSSGSLLSQGQMGIYVR
jgi:hypothetical protein